MKKTLAVLLISAIFINTCGYVLIYRTLKKVYKYSMFEKIESGEVNAPLEEIIVPAGMEGTANLKRVEKREIKYYGRMYDIVKEKHKGSYIYFYCINDENEDFLDKIFEENADNNTTSKGNKNPVNNIFKLAFQNALIFESSVKIVFIPVIVLWDIIIKSISLYKEIPTPPPQLSSGDT